MVTKRQLGLACIAVGVLAFGGILAYDLLRHHPIGERLQLVAMGGALLVIVFGAALLPLGDRPA